MTGYIVRRLLGVVTNLILVSIFIFFMLGVLPGDYAAAFLGVDATEDRIAQFKAENNLDKPVHERYAIWAGGVITGDFGESLRSREPVTSGFLRRLPITMEIVVISFIVTTAFGITGGIVSATRQNSFGDYGMRLVAVAGLSIPNFLLLTLLLTIPARQWSYAPPFGATRILDDPVRNLELFVPATAMLAVSSSAALIRLTRSAFLEVMRQDYMRTARAKGLAERVVTFRHGFRNALPPVLTLLGIQLSNLLGGTIILENVMGLPGLGQWTLSAININDYPIIMIIALYAAAALMLINLLIDLTYAWLDPRIKYS